MSAWVHIDVLRCLLLIARTDSSGCSVSLFSEEKKHACSMFVSAELAYKLWLKVLLAGLV